MIEKIYLEKMNSKFIVFEVMPGWYIKELDGFLLNMKYEETSYITEPENKSWFYRDGETATKEVELTTSVLYAEKFDFNSSDGEGLKKNFPSGKFSEIELTMKINQDCPL